MDEFKEKYRNDMDKIVLPTSKDQEILLDLYRKSEDGNRSNRKKSTNGSSHKWTKNAAAAAMIAALIGTSGTIANAASGGQVSAWIGKWFGAEKVTSENAELIGKEIIDDSTPSISSGAQSEKANVASDILSESKVVQGFADEKIVEPLSITDFQVVNDITPEIIMTNGSMAVFYQGNYSGWNCTAEDVLCFEFERYESEVIEEQTIVIGYIKDGIVYEGEQFKGESGTYVLNVEDDGIYNLYVISATSDYMTLKQETVSVKKKEATKDYKKGQMIIEGNNSSNEGSLTKYSENADGTWECEGYTYRYKLEITGRMENASADSTFVYLSNLKDISFEQAWKAAGLSSNTDDYFDVKDAVLVDWKTEP